ncbi:hypothetical protein H5410_057942 [Solanum commersonii]|uniref:Uncharacterized protein n=1 Tax=Solanum commersonii TaxID=4109 RepID=A0A9J5WS55_SOLCO|nr:hypothetical protein H5410_057942 [Solanum commersonii]
MASISIGLNSSFSIAVKSNKSSMFYTLRSTRGHILANLGKYEKIHKPPSGPNPNGNHRPPSRPNPTGNHRPPSGHEQKNELVV